jgi:hypothetical protein
VSHTITDVTLRDFKVYGIINWLDTPLGRFAKHINNNNIRFHIRALGTINGEENTTDIVDIITWDVELN